MTDRQKAIKLYHIMNLLETIDHQASFAVRMRLADLNGRLKVTMDDTALAARTGYWRPRQPVAYSMEYVAEPKEG